MASENEFREELLKADGLRRNVLYPEDREALGRILKRDRARVRRMKWVTVAVWGALFACWVGLGAALGRFSIGGFSVVRPVVRMPAYASGAFQALFYIALICTASYAVRAWVARGRESQVRMMEFQARLVEIEETLKRLVEKG